MALCSLFEEGSNIIAALVWFAELLRLQGVSEGCGVANTQFLQLLDNITGVSVGVFPAVLRQSPRSLLLSFAFQIVCQSYVRGLAVA